MLRSDFRDKIFKFHYFFLLNVEKSFTKKNIINKATKINTMLDYKIE